MVAKFDPSGSIGASLLWLTFLGSSFFDHGTGVATDKQGAVYVTGYTESRDFPTKNAFQPKFASTFNCEFKDLNGQGFVAPCDDAFISKIAGTGDVLEYSSFLGGEADDGGFSVFVDGSGIAYVSGFSGSNNFNTTTTAYERKLKGAFNSFVAKVGATGKLMYSTLIGGDAADIIYASVVDAQGEHMPGWRNHFH